MSVSGIYISKSLNKMYTSGYKFLFKNVLGLFILSMFTS